VFFVIFVLQGSDVRVVATLTFPGLPDSMRRVVMACTSTLASGQPCERPIYEGETCIFHSTRVDKDCALFDKEFGALLEEDQSPDCSGFIFPEKARSLEKRTFPTDVSFRQAIFLGVGGFARAQFGGKADFTGAQFARADFTEVQFAGPALFSRCQFMGESRFVGARFQDGITFHNARFAGPASFGQVRVAGRADFSRCTFASPVQFTGARFRAGVNFTTTAFHAKVTFSRARFADEAYFSETRFPGAEDCAGESGGDMSEVSFERPERVLFHRIDASRLSFLKTHLRRVDFKDLTWGRRSNGRIALWDELRPEREKDYAELARLYGQLRNNFEKDENHRAAADFRYGQMEMRRLRAGSGGGPIGRFFRRHCSLLACYKLVSDYGENPTRAGLLMLAVVFVFAGLFATGGFDAGPGVGRALQTSVAAFILQADPMAASLTTTGRWLVLVEGILGPVLIVAWAMAVARSLR
jgi:uncharacterized protein YjbI with pentapeptide repeats